MGLDAWTSLIVGVQLTDIGDIVEETEEKALTNSFGEPTGKTATLRYVYLDTPKERYPLGDNTRNATDRFRSNNINYGYDSIDTGELSVFVSSHEWEPNEAVIGMDVGKSLAEEGRFETLSGASENAVNEAMNLAKRVLMDEFDYDGAIQVFAMMHVSY